MAWHVEVGSHQDISRKKIHISPVLEPSIHRGATHEHVGQNQAKVFLWGLLSLSFVHGCPQAELPSEHGSLSASGRRLLKLKKKLTFPWTEEFRV